MAEKKMLRSRSELKAVSWLMLATTAAASTMPLHSSFAMINYLRRGYSTQRRHRFSRSLEH